MYNYDINNIKEQCPYIVSASRSTDIPAFYAEWFFNRLQKGYSVWKNPFNGVFTKISYKNTRFVVFWSKNPKPLLKYFNILEDKNINYYIQYTLNDYVNEKLEPRVPCLEERIDTFINIVETIDKKRLGKVIWRNDPLILTDKIGIDEHIKKIENIANQLVGYTKKMVFSFIDIDCYRNVGNNLKKYKVNYKNWDTNSMIEFAKEIQKSNIKWNFDIASCSEKIDLEQYGIRHNQCIDEKLIIKIAHNDDLLMKHLGVKFIDTKTLPLMNMINEQSKINTNTLQKYEIKKNNRDKGQREKCGCIKSKDIGQYNTCPHMCIYCYANYNPDSAIKSYKKYKLNIDAETII